jgi:hypothetical protein
MSSCNERKWYDTETKLQENCCQLLICLYGVLDLAMPSLVVSSPLWSMIATYFVNLSQLWSRLSIILFVLFRFKLWHQLNFFYTKIKMPNQCKGPLQLLNKVRNKKFQKKIKTVRKLLNLATCQNTRFEKCQKFDKVKE